MQANVPKATCQRSVRAYTSTANAKRQEVRHEYISACCRVLKRASCPAFIRSTGAVRVTGAAAAHPLLIPVAS